MSEQVKRWTDAEIHEAFRVGFPTPRTLIDASDYDRDTKALWIDIESENEAYETAARLCDEKAQELREWNKRNLARWASHQARAFEEMAREIRDYKSDATLTEGEK